VSDNDEQDRIPYRNAPLTAATAQRKMRGDARIAEGELVSYLGPDGGMLAWGGDREAPYVKVLQDPPALFTVSLIPLAAAPVVGVMIASLIPASLHEAWATDERDVDLNPAPRWLLVFDRIDAPNAGDQPAIAALRICGTCSYDFIEAPLQFNTGIVFAISTTPNIYTAIVAASDFAITARVLAGS